MKNTIAATRAGTRAPKYVPFPPIDLPDRKWPGQTITRAPIWLSTDLRDGNQALFEPMNAERKLRMFKMLVDIGFKEIEVGFPAASDTDFQFVRRLVEEGHIPEDVTIGVLTQARDELIARTMESVRGAPRAILHLYNATAPVFRRVVFGLQKPEVIDLAVRCTKLVRSIADSQPATDWTYQYSPETFSQTELEFARDICNAVVDAWAPEPGKPVILNLPATVEMCTPNTYADQIEWMHRNLARRGDTLISVHPHNDRGTAVAAAELAVMAGADRVEGCLFGNGERTGNVDLVTLAINLYTQGVDPELDFSDIDTIARTCEHCTQLPVHPRHPWAGDLVFTAFSGSHQDAIKKGFAAQQADTLWEVPYLPIDPADLGRSYDAIVRVNSQSGKGGIAFLLEASYGLVLPRRHLVEFSGVVQRVADQSGQEQTADALWRLFEDEYLKAEQPIRYIDHTTRQDGDQTVVELAVERRSSASADAKSAVGVVLLTGRGNGPIDAALDALGRPAVLQSYEERALGGGSAARAVAFIEMAIPGVPGSTFGAGVHENIVTASLLALVSGFNRLAARSPQIVSSIGGTSVAGLRAHAANKPGERGAQLVDVA